MADSPGRGEVAVSVRLDGLTLATYLKDLGQANVESVGLLKMEPIEEEGEDLGVFEGSEDEGMEEEEGSPSEGSSEDYFSLFPWIIEMVAVQRSRRWTVLYIRAP